MDKNEVVRILIKDHHDSKEDLVSRPLVRAYRKLNSNGIKQFITDNGIYLYGHKKGNVVTEIITQQVMNVSDKDYEVFDSGELLKMFKSLKKREIQDLHILIRKYVFGENVNVNFMEVSTMEERASDRAVQFKEFNKGLSDVNPYDKEHLTDYDQVMVGRKR